MKSVGAYETKTHLPRLLARVARGERFTITRNGTPVALLIPAGGRVKLSTAEAVAAIRQLRLGRKLRGLSIREMIREGRHF